MLSRSPNHRGLFPLIPRHFVVVVVLASLVMVGARWTVGSAQAPLINVVTQHNDNARTGANLDETVLSTGNVNVHRFGKLFTRQVDGQIYAQPLYLSQFNMGQRGTHNVVYVATQHNSVYAFDADDPTASVPLWQINLGPAAPSTDFCDYNEDGSCGEFKNIFPEVGITSTPVIDQTTNSMYVVALTKDATTGAQAHKLWALDLRTGQPLPATAARSANPVAIQGTVPGNGSPCFNCGTLTFDSKQQLQRPALLLSRGVVYIAFGSYADWFPYHGWVFGYAAATLQRIGIFNTTPDGDAGAIWQSGQGPAADDQGNVYLIAANGTFGAIPNARPAPDRRNLGNSFLKLSPVVTATGIFPVLDSFTPYNYEALNAVDNDLGSTGVLLVPGTNLLLGGSKEGNLYVLDRDQFGGYRAADDDQIVQRFLAADTSGAHYNTHGTPVFWNGPRGPLIYIWPEGTPLRAYALTSGLRTNGTRGPMFTPTPVAQSPMRVPPGMPGGFLSLSANGSQAGSGIIWASHPLEGDAHDATVLGIMRAFDASDASRELWNSQQNAVRDKVGTFSKFNSPTIANGKVYAATFNGELVVYGLLPPQVFLPLVQR